MNGDLYDLWSPETDRRSDGGTVLELDCVYDFLKPELSPPQARDACAHAEARYRAVRGDLSVLD